MWLCLLALLSDQSSPLAAASTRLAPTAFLSYPLFILHLPLINTFNKISEFLPPVQIGDQGLQTFNAFWFSLFSTIVVASGVIHIAVEGVLSLVQRYVWRDKSQRPAPDSHEPNYSSQSTDHVETEDPKVRYAKSSKF